MSGTPMKMRPENFLQEILAHDTSGTSAEPDSTPIPMLMRQSHGWNLMFHVNAFILDEQSTKPGGSGFSPLITIGADLQIVGAASSITKLRGCCPSTIGKLYVVSPC